MRVCVCAHVSSCLKMGSRNANRESEANLWKAHAEPTQNGQQRFRMNIMNTTHSPQHTLRPLPKPTHGICIQQALAYGHIPTRGSPKSLPSFAPPVLHHSSQLFHSHLCVLQGLRAVLIRIWTSRVRLLDLKCLAIMNPQHGVSRACLKMVGPL